jgi:polysaccharide deacetylase 2 family uncharacterized protein YibQ
MIDLGEPLGLKAPGSGKTRRPIALVPLALLVGLLLAGGLWVALVDDPLGGEPVATARLDTAAEALAGEGMSVVDVRSPAAAEVPGEAPAPAEGPREDAGRFDLVAAEGLIEDGPHGPLPRIAASGARPIDAYARRGPVVVGGAPRIAIIVGGLGISQSGTQAALAALPPDITLAFAPYGASLDRWVGRAREAGHEVLLQIPLEPFDYPDNDPGPETLLTTLSPADNLDRLHWLLARITGYVGVVNYMGARYTAAEAPLTATMDEIAGRGLLWVDDGSSARSLSAGIAGEAMPFAKVDVVIDAVASPEDIAARLSQLEGIARGRGVAIGAASALPVSVERLAAWAETLEARGITLIPITATIGQ